MNITRNKTEKFITQLRHATHGQRRNTSEISKYRIISQPKLDKFQFECYSRCSKWRPLVSLQQCIRLCHWSTASSIVVAETRESVVGYQAMRVRSPST